MIYDPKSQRSNIRQIAKIKLAKPYKAKSEASLKLDVDNKKLTK